MRILRLVENKIVCESGPKEFTIINDWKLLEPDEQGSINWIIQSTTPDMPFALSLIHI